jgi:predicted kinase
MAAGKSTLSKELAMRENAVHLAQDGFLEALYPGEIIDLAAFVKYATRLQSVLTPHIVALLTKGVSVVLDFPANTKRQRAWFRQLIEMSGSDHELHFIVASDEVCKRQLKQRNQEYGLPPGAKWTTEADFEQVTAYFDPPAVDEGFNVIRHERAA